eukprot:CAMPEP_0204174548 /NCGR_PEP_ID=MMETSP0361-20130328/45973_1 /ASSEMBLY_ACC=CAM_ASM_000343 /TAXON_ID=268821 /ORGANISM="Scrippsiella Hangoei, Strain SHTV-5" /LENGTH=91 /DNA_ID=CAMNT_0051133035 /DNA_START=666 /DNA_END=941 /DNA_ORIENTATION=-
MADVVQKHVWQHLRALWSCRQATIRVSHGHHLHVLNAPGLKCPAVRFVSSGRPLAHVRKLTKHLWLAVHLSRTTPSLIQKNRDLTAAELPQ